MKIPGLIWSMMETTPQDRAQWKNLFGSLMALVALLFPKWNSTLGVINARVK